MAETVTSDTTLADTTPTVTQLTTYPSGRAQQIAAQKVFAIYELLESIILALPQSDILLAAYVSTSWYDLVSTSLAVEDQLFDLDGQQHTPTKSGVDCSWFLFARVYDIVHRKFPQGNLVIRRLGSLEIIGLFVFRRRGASGLGGHLRRQERKLQSRHHQ